MPLKPLKLCRHPLCSSLVSTGYCDKHKQSYNKEYDSQRESPSIRGYNRQWYKVRAIKLQLNPLCEDCGRQGRIVSAKEIHHVEKIKDRQDLRLDIDNLMSLCTSCHSRRTIKGQ